MTKQSDFAAVKAYSGPANAPSTQTQDMLKQLLAANMKSLKSILPSHLTPERVCRVSLTTVSRTPGLLKCTPQSLLMAIMAASSLGLEPDMRGLAYLVPYGNKCNLVIGYKGMLELAYRSGSVKRIFAEVVGENDVFDAEFGLEPRLVHKPCLTSRGQIVAAYAIATMKDDGKQFCVMLKEDIDACMRAGAPGGPWQTWPTEMAKKSVIKRLLKLLPTANDSLQKAISLDDQADASVKQSLADVIDIELPDVQEGDENDSAS